MIEFAYFDIPHELLDDGVYEFVDADVDITSAVCAALHGGHYRTWRRTMRERYPDTMDLGEDLRTAELDSATERFLAFHPSAELVDIEPEPDDDEADDFTGE
jgi:hypothetical protein